jgi:hypothetical protein
LQVNSGVTGVKAQPKEALEALSGNERWFRVTDNSSAELNGKGVYISDFRWW